MKKVLLLLLWPAFAGSLGAQNLYDREHTEKFAGHLLATRQYAFALEEYERILYFDPSDHSIRMKIIQICRQGGLWQQGIERVNRFYPAKAQMPADMAAEYLEILLYMGASQSALGFLGSYTALKPKQHLQFTLDAYLLQKDWSGAGQKLALSDSALWPVNPAYLQLIDRGVNLRSKKAGIALLMSTLVPGTGKVYAGQWKDGLISFLFTAVSGWQAYRGFDQKGTQSVYGWISGGLAAGFYLGNLYGSVKAVRKFNKRQHNDLLREAQQIIYTRY